MITVDSNLFHAEVYAFLQGQRKPNSRPISDFLKSFNLKCLASKAEHLDLSYRNLTDEDMGNLCKGLKTNIFLKSINLSGNLLSPDSAEKIMDIFTDNTYLEIIQFSEHQIPAQKKQDIETFLQVNQNKNHKKMTYR